MPKWSVTMKPFKGIEKEMDRRRGDREAADEAAIDLFKSMGVPLPKMKSRRGQTIAGQLEGVGDIPGRERQLKVQEQEALLPGETAKYGARAEAWEGARAKHKKPTRTPKPAGFWGEHPTDPNLQARREWRYSEEEDDWESFMVQDKGGDFASRKRKEEKPQNIDPRSDKGIEQTIKLEKLKKALPLTSKEKVDQLAKFDKLKDNIGEEAALNAINAGLESSGQKLGKTVTRGWIEWLRQEVVPEGVPGSLPDTKPGWTNPAYELTPVTDKMAGEGTFNDADIATTMKANPHLSREQTIQQIEAETRLQYIGR